MTPIEKEEILNVLSKFNTDLTSMQRAVLHAMTLVNSVGVVRPEPMPEVPAAPVTPEVPATPAAPEPVVEKIQEPAPVQAVTDVFSNIKGVVDELLLPPTPPAPVTQPTVEGTETKETKSAVDDLHDKGREFLLAQFYGTATLFHRWLSPTVLKNARGYLQPNGTDLYQFGEDALLQDLGALAQWPSGFYRNKQTKGIEFVLNTGDAIVILDESSQENPIRYVGLKFLSDGGAIPADQLVAIPVHTLDSLTLARLADAVIKKLQTIFERGTF
jgi:hypothetical protein